MHFNKYKIPPFSFADLHDDAGHDVFEWFLELGEAGQAGFHHTVSPLVHFGVLKILKMKFWDEKLYTLRTYNYDQIKHALILLKDWKEMSLYRVAISANRGLNCLLDHVRDFIHHKLGFL